MRVLSVVLVLGTVGVSAADAQQRPTDPALDSPRFDLSLGYNHVNANAPPGSCVCFGLNGGYASGAFHVTHWLSLAGEFTGGHANNISFLGQDLTLTTFVAGPRVSYPGHRLVPFGQALFGGAHGSDSYFPTGTSSSSSASSFAISTGGGLDVNLTHRFAVRALEVQYLRTSFPNGVNGEQNHLMTGAGIVLKFGGNSTQPASPVLAQRPSEISFTCATDVASIEQGQKLEIVGNTKTEPDNLDVSYSWSSNGGTIQGTGRRVTLDTASIPAGEYRVTGHATLASSSSTSAECETTFRVTAANPHTDPAPSVASAAPIPALNTDRTANEKVFHDNVPDALFDYDSYEIRPDAKVAIAHAASYLIAHPDVRVLIGGYSDERGSAEYNVALSENRANAARMALINAGVAADRLQIVSYGKEVQVCTAENERCWQENRRAAFALHP